MHTVSLVEAVTKSKAAIRYFLTFEKAELSRFGDDIPAVWKSFWAFAIVAPLQFYIAAALYEGTPAEQVPWLTRLIAEISGYAIQAVYWPLAMVLFADLLQKPEGYARYVSAYNWCVVPATILSFLLVMIFGVSDGAAGVPGLILTFWVILFRIKLARHVFDVPVGVAIALAAGDFLLGAFVVWMQSGVLSP